MERHPTCCIIPDHVLRRIAERGNDEERRSALETLAATSTLRSTRTQAEARRAVAPRAPTDALASFATPSKERIIRDAHGQADLRGPIVRQEGDTGDPGDPAVAEAFEYLGVTWDFYFVNFARNSIDKGGMVLEGVVHYREGYDNAVWNGAQMVFGDGSGLRFTRLTQSLAVCGHELSHGVIQYDGPLTYLGESGALNESMADVLGVLADQWHRGESAADADWLVGREILAPGVSGSALRSLKAPGTAYDDDVLGKDDQPSHMRDFVQTDLDNGGVHINSGIPNHAFYLVAMELGGNAWGDAGRIWYATLGHDRLMPTSTFRQFARLTRYVAGVLFGQDSRQQQAVGNAWQEVGLEL
jgi:Zn-dependent metalloprotease